MDEVKEPSSSIWMFVGTITLAVGVVVMGVDLYAPDAPPTVDARLASAEPPQPIVDPTNR